MPTTVSIFYKMQLISNSRLTQRLFYSYFTCESTAECQRFTVRDVSILLLTLFWYLHIHLKFNLQFSVGTFNCLSYVGSLPTFAWDSLENTLTRGQSSDKGNEPMGHRKVNLFLVSIGALS